MKYSNHTNSNMALDPLTRERVDKTKLGKRVAYLLRYGAEKEGIEVKEGGYVPLCQLMQVPLMRHHTAKEVLEEVEQSKGSRGSKRYESKVEGEETYVRARYLRRMERSSFHEGTKVKRLLDTTMDFICQNHEMYDLQDFPDEYLIGQMIHKLKREKKLNSKVFQTLLCPALTHLDLHGVYVTEKIMNHIARNCSGLTHLNLKDCGYVMTDHLAQRIFKKLCNLEVLNLEGCRHLTDSTIILISKHLTNLQQIYLTYMPKISEKAVFELLDMCPNLLHVDIYDNRNITEDGRLELAKIMSLKNITINLK
ncbi:F-box protein SKP2B [Lingula anatina]|uniref:2'-phosphotransferase n=1 Tax=Lingula anatina TaxID=7574 RepID=A0A1S3H5P2_LINAN|nr:F-box protein SKP2B [Lingula anatina]|eukprot:XP_013381287.1 F-box protein SKP2B [Lingula anatina]